MQKELGKDIPDGEKRKAFLIDNCDAVEEKGYMKRFNSEQLALMKDALSETAIRINDIEIEKKSVMDDFKEQLKPLEKEKKRILTGLKNKAEHTIENVYKYVDTDTRMVGYYNENGDLIESRPAYADELSLFRDEKVVQLNGTNN